MDIDAAIEAARGARERAYAPCSGFRMGGPDLQVVAATVEGPVEQHRLTDLLPRGPHQS